jgi:GTP-binding protein HflX
VQRQGRGRDGLTAVALVGYTNAGKSSLMNRLLSMGDHSAGKLDDKRVFEKDMLFATLDTSIRKIALPGRKPFLLSDTVGFIEDIPHDLIKAFRSTLAEVKYADVLLIVLDSSDPHYTEHRKVTEDTLKDLDALSIPRLYVYNKADIRDKDLTIENAPGSESVFISAKTGYGMDELLDAIETVLSEGSKEIDVVIPYTAGDLLNRLHENAQVLSQSYEEDGVHILAVCPAHIADAITSGKNGITEEN